MAMSTTKIIERITATGARFVLDGDRLGLDRVLPAKLMQLARNHKTAIRHELTPIPVRLKTAGLQRLKVAAAGLPITLDELAVIFADDLQDFGSGAVSMDGIRQACQWFARGKADAPIEPDTRVTCTTCKQTGCPHPLTYGRHNSPQPRNCKAWRAA